MRTYSSWKCRENLSPYTTILRTGKNKKIRNSLHKLCDVWATKTSSLKLFYCKRTCTITNTVPQIYMIRKRTLEKLHKIMPVVEPVSTFSSIFYAASSTRTPEPQSNYFKLDKWSYKSSRWSYRSRNVATAKHLARTREDNWCDHCVRLSIRWLIRAEFFGVEELHYFSSRSQNKADEYTSLCFKNAICLVEPKFLWTNHFCDVSTVSLYWLHHLER